MRHNMKMSLKPQGFSSPAQVSVLVSGRLYISPGHNTQAPFSPERKTQSRGAQHIMIIMVSSHLTHLCFAQTALFLVLVAVFQSHSVAGLLTDNEKSLYFGLEEGGKYF